MAYSGDALHRDLQVGGFPYRDNENFFVPVDVKPAYSVLHKTALGATWEQLLELARGFFAVALSRSGSPGYLSCVANVVIDWGQRVSSEDRDHVTINRMVSPMKPVSAINHDFEWFHKHHDNLLQTYFGQWIAIADQKVISHGNIFIEVLKAARKQGHGHPFVAKLYLED